MTPPPPRSTLFPYTTLFRSSKSKSLAAVASLRATGLRQALDRPGLGGRLGSESGRGRRRREGDDRPARSIGIGRIVRHEQRRQPQAAPVLADEAAETITQFAVELGGGSG